MKKEALAALFAIRLRYGAREWRARDVADLGLRPQYIVALHVADYILRARPLDTRRPIWWRLSPSGLQVGQIPARRIDGKLWPLSYPERVVWAAWRAVGRERYLRRDVPVWARPLSSAPDLVRPVGPGPLPNSLYWQITDEGAALAERLDAILLEQWGQDVWRPVVPAREQSDPSRPSPRRPRTSAPLSHEARRERDRERSLAYYYAHRDEINARKRAKYAAEKQRELTPHHGMYPDEGTTSSPRTSTRNTA